MTEVDVRPQRAHHSLGGARVLARKLRGEPCPTFRRRAPRHGCQPCFRGSRLPSRVPSALSPSGPASAAHTLDQDSPANGNVSRAGDDCGVVVLKRRWHDHRPASQTGQRGACSRSAEQETSPPPPAWAATGGRQPSESRAARPLRRLKDQLAGPFSTDGLAAPLRVARRRAAPPPDDY